MICTVLCCLGGAVRCCAVRCCAVRCCAVLCGKVSCGTYSGVIIRTGTEEHLVFRPNVIPDLTYRVLQIDGEQSD